MAGMGAKKAVDGGHGPRVILRLKGTEHVGQKILRHPQLRVAAAPLAVKPAQFPSQAVPVPAQGVRRIRGISFRLFRPADAPGIGLSGGLIAAPSRIGRRPPGAGSSGRSSFFHRRAAADQDDQRGREGENRLHRPVPLRSRRIRPRGVRGSALIKPIDGLNLT